MSVTSRLAMDADSEKQCKMVRGIQGADVHHSKGEDRIWKWIISLPALVSDPGLATPDETLAEERAVGRLEISSRPTYPESCGDTEIVKLREIDLQKARDGLSAKESKLLCSKPDPHDQTPVESKCSKRRFSQTWESQPSSCEQGLLLIRRNAYELDSISPDDEVARNTDLRASPESPLPSLSQSSWGGCGMPWKHSSHGAAFEIVQNTEERISPESPLPSVSQSSSQDQIEPYEHNSNESAIGLTQGPDIRAIPESPLPEVSQSSPQDSTRWPASSDGNLEDHLERTLAHQSTPYNDPRSVLARAWEQKRTDIVQESLENSYVSEFEGTYQKRTRMRALVRKELGFCNF